MQVKRVLACIIGVTAFVGNPWLACSGDWGNDSSGFTYGESEMVSAVEGSWRLDVDLPDGTRSYELMLAKGPPGQAGTSLKCSTREFMSIAGACIDVSTLHLAGVATFASDELPEAVVTGSYSVMSLNYVGGSLELSFSDVRLHAELDADNEVRHVQVTMAGVTQAASLERQP
jgi:hypothetical protein